VLFRSAHIRELIEQIGYATTPTQLVKVVNQLKHVHDLTHPWLRGAMDMPTDPENPPISDTEWLRRGAPDRPSTSTEARRRKRLTFTAPSSPLFKNSHTCRHRR